jgi:hypothetical protein
MFLLEKLSKDRIFSHSTKSNEKKLNVNELPKYNVTINHGK